MSLLGVAWSNIIVGVASALLVGVGMWGKDRLYDVYLEYKYPVAGNYVTEFEDEIGGEKVISNAPAKLKQRGRRVRGKTVMPHGEREWVVEGEISTDGYLNGVYYATDPHDRGVGNFFLYIDHDRRMEGLWSGYDEVNQKISSGKYVFTPRFDAFDIESLERSSIPAVVHLSDQRLGKNYLEAGLLKESLDPESSYFTQVASIDSSFETDESVADRLAEAILQSGPAISRGTTRYRSQLDSKIIGFCLSAVFSISQLEDYLHISKEDLPNAIVHAEKVGVIRTVSVHENFESQGIGTELVGNGIEECFAQGAMAICVVGWREDGTVNLKGIMDHYSFETTGEYDNYWHDESLELEYACSNCGSPPCTCPAVLFAKYR